MRLRCGSRRLPYHKCETRNKRRFSIPGNEANLTHCILFLSASFQRSAKRQTEPAEKKTKKIKKSEHEKRYTAASAIQTKSAARSGISITVQQNLGKAFTLHTALFSYCYVLPDPYGALKHVRLRELLSLNHRLHIAQTNSNPIQQNA